MATQNSIDDLNTLTWEWMKKTMSELDDIAKLARDASKRSVSLADKVALKRIARRAEAGHGLVATVFGERV